MERFDFVLAGGGAAGLCLAHALINSPLGDGSILLIDREEKRRNDRTWCFWSRRPGPFDAIACHRWKNIRISNEHSTLQIPLQPYRYLMIRGIDFYNAMLKQIRAHPTAQILTGTVERVHDGPTGAVVTVNGNDYMGSWVFDSLFDPRHIDIPLERYHFLLQHFVGWVIRAEHPFCDPDCVTLFDFRVPQLDATCFVYILPFAANEALVEYTLFSPHRLRREQYEETLRDYIEVRLGVGNFEILEQEDGAIPMSDYPFARRGGRHICHTGTKGGMVKASTGYAFDRIRRDSETIVASLLRNGSPFPTRRPAQRYALFDSMLLNILQYRGKYGASILHRLFARNPIRRLLRFLDEEGGILENLQLMHTVRWRLFIAALLRILARRIRP